MDDQDFAADPLPDDPTFAPDPSADEAPADQDADGDGPLPDEAAPDAAPDGDDAADEDPTDPDALRRTLAEERARRETAEQEVNRARLAQQQAAEGQFLDNIDHQVGHFWRQVWDRVDREGLAGEQVARYVEQERQRIEGWKDQELARFFSAREQRLWNAYSEAKLPDLVARIAHKHGLPPSVAKKLTKYHPNQMDQAAQDLADALADTQSAKKKATQQQRRVAARDRIASGAAAGPGAGAASRGPQPKEGTPEHWDAAYNSISWGRQR